MTSLRTWTSQPTAQFSIFILDKSTIPHINCPFFVPTLTSSDPEASLRYSLAIFSNPHIHSLWLCWEIIQLRLRITPGDNNNNNNNPSPQDISLPTAEGVVPQVPGAHTQPHGCCSGTHSWQEHEVMRHTHSSGGPGWAEMQLGDTGLPASVRALHKHLRIQRNLPPNPWALQADAV